MGTVLQILGGAWAGLGVLSIVATALLHTPLAFGLPGSVLLNIGIFILPGFLVGGFGAIVRRQTRED